MNTAKKEFIEYRFEKHDNPKLSIIITTDKNNVITEINNPFKIQNPFKVFYFMHKLLFDKWKETNGLIERGRMTYSENIKVNEYSHKKIKHPMYLAS